MEKGTGFDIEKFKSRYDKLKTAPLEVWIAEFLKRNEQFQKDCMGVRAYRAAKKAKGKGGSPESLFPGKLFWHLMLHQKYGVALRNWEPEKRKKSQKLTVSLLPPVRGIRIMKSSSDRTAARDLKKNASLYGGSNKESFLDLRDQRLMVIGEKRVWRKGSWVIGGSRIERDSCHFAMDDLLGGVSNNNGLYNIRDTLLLAIDLWKPRNEIDDVIDKFLAIHLLPTTTRRVPEKWLHYLMAYDLRMKHGMTPKEIANLLSRSYPDKSVEQTNLSSEKNIRNYIHSAEKLIEGRYREYL